MPDNQKEDKPIKTNFDSAPTPNKKIPIPVKKEEPAAPPPKKK